jgi:hypothetical protein
MTEKIEEQKPVEQPAPTAQPETTDNDLNISDLASMKQIIDIASSRGAFKAGEMEAVGKVYNKLASFLAQVAAKGGQNGQS